MRRVLVVYYSRSGTTGIVAKEVAHELDADLEQILETRPRAGMTGYLRSAVDGALHRRCVIEQPKLSPSDYDVVVVGTPVWMGALSSPVRTFLLQEDLPDLAFFSTAGGGGSDRAIDEMQQVSGKIPVATMNLFAGDVRYRGYLSELEHFVDEIQAALERYPASPGMPNANPLADLARIAWW